MTDPCPVCDGEHQWRSGEVFMGIPMIVCPTIPASQPRVIRIDLPPPER